MLASARLIYGVGAVAGDATRFSMTSALIITLIDGCRAMLLPDTPPYAAFLPAAVDALCRRHSQLFTIDA